MRRSGDKLTVVHETQQQSNWCWIACCRMAASGFGIVALEQCEIAQIALGVLSCCPAGSNRECDRTLDAPKVPTFYQSQRMHASVMPVSDQMFQSSLSIGSLVLVMLDYPSGYHFVLATAFGSGTYTINDPKLDGPYQATFSDLENLPSATMDTAWRVETS